MKLSELKTGEKGIITRVTGHGSFRKRVIELGFVNGKTVRVVRNAPLKDPVEYEVMGSQVALQRAQAAMIEVVGEHENICESKDENAPLDEYRTLTEKEMQEIATRQEKTITVAFVGNPNCGKTSIYNYLTGANEHVGNYSGVTVDARETTFAYGGYTFRFVDLPGTYSLSAYSPEERYVREYLINNSPDIVLNVVDASNIERNLYLTTQLMDMDVRMMIALNMYDDLSRRGDSLDYVQLSRLLGMPIVPTVGKTGAGLNHLMHLAILIYEKGDYVENGNNFNQTVLNEMQDWYKSSDDEDKCREGKCHNCSSCPSSISVNLKQIYHHVHVNHGYIIEKRIGALQKLLKENQNISSKFSTRYIAIKLLENDPDAEKLVRDQPHWKSVLEKRDKLTSQIEQLKHEDSETAITDAKYAFISGALKESYTENIKKKKSRTEIIDSIVTHKILGYPIFLGFMFLMFEATFSVGAYPQGWIESVIDIVAAHIDTYIADSALKDLITDGVLGGVGSILSFVPNILILYLFISMMEDSGYMARAAFIMDKLMHKIGLHGRSFIPLIMGFGCTVPAVMACRTIEDRRNRFITVLITPFMSCTARLPIYILLIGVFFPSHPGIVLFGIYLFGILVAALSARLLSKTLFKNDGIPFVIELPPYRIPRLAMVLEHTWNKGYAYMKKLGGVVLIASVIIWALGYFPRTEGTVTAAVQQENSYIGKIGKTIEPVMEPLGFNWKLSVGLVSGIGAKELVVSTLSVLYNTGYQDVDENALAKRIPIAPNVALAYLIFILLYVPCISSFSATAQETSLKWALLQAGYGTTLAWLCALIVKVIGGFFL